LTPHSLDDWLAFISAQHPSTIALGLDRVREVAARMGLAPPPAAITVGGTNGKGSTCAMLERILVESGYRVGGYSSPHLLRYNERVRVDGVEASDAVLAASFERVEAVRGATALTYFEFGTLAALAVFEEAKVEAVVLEVGLGGRLDAVNIVDADCAIVVSVDLDHQAFLGNDREAIGFEKAGIFRSARPAIFGDTDPPTRLVEHARSIEADLQVLGRDFHIEAGERQWDFIGRAGARRALPMPALRGRWQLKNAACALAALGELTAKLPVSLGEVKRGLGEVRLAGRLQVLPGRPVVVLDVAHNPHAARALAGGLGEMGRFARTTAVFAMLADKDIEGVIDAVRDRIDRWYVSAAAAERAAPVERLQQALAARGLDTAMRAFPSVEEAYSAARSEAGANDRIVVFGSFHTVAEALRIAC
jgi:dihydrofolate synthase / folylpolyglutamate synthase